MFTDTAKEYNIRDALGTVLIDDELDLELVEYHLTSFYDSIVQPLAEVVIDLNMRGLYVDQEARVIAVEEITKEIEVLQANVNLMLGEEVNVDGERFKEIVYHELQIRPVSSKRTKKGYGKTDKGTLKKFISMYPDIGLLFETVLALKKNKKLKSTFLSFPVDPDGRIKPNYRIGPVTGRLACKKPNFANIPKGAARRVFVAEPGKVFVYGDFSQVEVRIQALIAGDDIVLAWYEKGKDVHDMNARDLFKIPPNEEVGDRQRFFSKMFQFGVIQYGGSVEGVKERGAEMLSDVPVERMQAMADRYFEQHPALRVYREETERMIIATKKLVNVFGRPRIFFGPVKEVIRSGFNFRIQSGAADVMNVKLIELNRRFPHSLVLYVYDSAMLEVLERDVERVAREMKEIMESPVEEFGKYSFPAKIEIGHSWGEF